MTAGAAWELVLLVHTCFAQPCCGWQQPSYRQRQAEVLPSVLTSDFFGMSLNTIQPVSLLGLISTLSNSSEGVLVFHSAFTSEVGCSCGQMWSF